MMRFEQPIHGCDWLYHAMEEVIAQGQTPYQSYLFFRHPLFGVTIAIDGDMQSAQCDEGIYHEALVHPALLLHPDPQNVLIMGGGEGATAREVLRHSRVKRCVMVDIDGAFVEACRQFAPTWSDGAFEDSRMDLRVMDIHDFLKKSDERFDVVIGDLVDVADWNSPVATLYGETFYEKLKQRLRPGAMVATQAGALGVAPAINHQKVRQALGHSFGHCESYGVVVPSFGGLWGFVVASSAPIDLGVFAKRCETSSLSLPAIGVGQLPALFALPQSIIRAIGANDA